jgi:drug/metabolite transporter (DMT)-like permease
MPLLAILLLLVSALLHAAWNFLGKRQHPSAAFMLAANTFGTLALVPLLAASWPAVRSFPPVAWGLLVLTGICQAVYYIALAGAYRAGDMALTYPLVRALPILLVTGLSWLLAQGEPASRQALSGMALIVLGCLILPLRQFSQLRPRSYADPALALALLAALGVVGYSILDDRALRLLRPDGGLSAGNMRVTLAYAALSGLSASAWGAAFIALRRADRRELRRMQRGDLRQAAIVGVFIFAAYSLVLIALALVRNVGYAVAFRQLSIPLGALLAITILKEPAYGPRLLGIGLVFAGVALVAMG